MWFGGGELLAVFGLAGAVAAPVELVELGQQSRGGVRGEGRGGAGGQSHRADGFAGGGGEGDLAGGDVTGWAGRAWAVRAGGLAGGAAGFGADEVGGGKPGPELLADHVWGPRAEDRADR